MSKGRPPIDREMQAWRARLAVVNAGLLACYETIAEGNRQKAELEAKIAARTNGPSRANGSDESQADNFPDKGQSNNGEA